MHDIQQKLFPNMQQNEDMFHSLYANCSDIVYRTFLISGSIKALLVFIDGLSNCERIEDYVIDPLMRGEHGAFENIAQLVSSKIPVSQTTEVTTFAQCIEHLSLGCPILLWDNEAYGAALNLASWEKRGIEEPAAEAGIRGPREGFTETLRTNTSQIRRIIKSHLLRTETLKIGEYTRTNIIIAYIDGVVDTSLVEEVRSRLSNIQIDGILESEYIEEMIEDQPYSPFPQLLSTERPDVVCSCLLEGRIAILTEGTPFVLVAPITLFSLFQSHEDYYQRFIISTFIRWLRYCFILISLLLPSLYVAILTFHQEMVPGSLLISMASSREAVPFSALIEALIMEIAFEAMREAGVRLPKQVGAAVSIVGALVIGQAAVHAGLVSAPMVIVVAITGIASFMIPRYIAGIAVRILRFPLIFLAGSLGLLGIMMGIIAIVLHLSSLRSLGVPYLSTLTTPKTNEMNDVLIRAPWWKLSMRFRRHNP
ncbi:spore germination protein [Paenibacillus sp. CGMCC 1.16610]|uniref:Spore germination protein n=1 Tax=Paenibacillus anseongense TaxID=2682845 RepID=A0ABW9UJU0_9BACL|nr:MULTISPECIES: spore germination protein [Paenibacillus]MBA2939855.1 spore germination protein [Paenibacillus sp. CGMCC 1.16610]MVQ39515.1 spore germination protein [Paenibacillus anseongense]